MMNASIEQYELEPTEGIRGLIGRFNRDGLVVVRGLSRDEWERLVDGIATRRHHRDSDGQAVTQIEANRTDRTPGFAGFTRRSLRAHTDGSAEPSPPSVLSMWCDTQAARGGASILVDAAAVLEDLSDSNPSLVSALREVPVTLGGTSQYSGPLVHTTADNRWSLRFRDDGLAQYEGLGRHLSSLRFAIERAQISFMLAAGDAYFLANDRWLHGRASFEGSRVMARILGDPIMTASPRVITGFDMRPKIAARAS